MRNLQYLSGLGNPDLYSPGLAGLTSGGELRRRVTLGELELQDLSNGKTLIREQETGAWFRLVGSEMSPQHTMLLGAVCGDVAGSIYEHFNTKEILSLPELVHPQTRVTDDSVMTLAVADGIRMALTELGENWTEHPDANRILLKSLQKSVLHFGRAYPGAGYGGAFRRWLKSYNPKPYNSWGNGSAMRASYCGWCANTLEEAERLAELSAAITHDHPEGIKGAKVVAGSIYLLRAGKDKEEIRRYAGAFYDMNFTLADIRPFYCFDVSCQGSVPQAIEAFLEGKSFAEVIALAISIGGDSDTIAAIAGSLAEVVYPIPEELRHQAVTKMDGFQRKVYREAVDFAFRYSDM